MPESKQQRKSPKEEFRCMAGGEQAEENHKRRIPLFDRSRNNRGNSEKKNSAVLPGVKQQRKFRKEEFRCIAGGEAAEEIHKLRIPLYS